MADVRSDSRSKNRYHNSNTRNDRMSEPSTAERKTPFDAP